MMNESNVKILVVYAHPTQNGHCANIFQEIKTQLKDRVISFTILDLHKAKFSSILHADELYTQGGKLNADSEKIRQLFADHNRIIFVYPIWWNSMPAILKGFFDKVLIAKYAFEFRQISYLPFPVPVGLLTDKKALAFTTTGSAGWQALLFLGNRFKTLFCRDICGFCGIKSKMITLYSCTNWSEKRLPEMKKKVEKGLDWILK